MKLGGRRRVAGSVLVALALCPLGSAAGLHGAGTQILRPGQERSEDISILRTERVARLTLRLPVEREAAYDAWIDANRLVEWFPHWAEMTVTEGGSYEIGWEGYDGVWQGTYLVVQRPERLSFTWLPPASVFPSGAYETTVDLLFEEGEDGGTILTLEHTGFEGAAELEAQLQAWRAYLFALRAYLLQAQ